MVGTGTRWSHRSECGPGSRRSYSGETPPNPPLHPSAALTTRAGGDRWTLRWARMESAMAPIVTCGLLIAAGLIGIAVAFRNRAPEGVRNRAALEEAFPPISDAEFLARCPPGTRPEVALKVRQIV